MTPQMNNYGNTGSLASHPSVGGMAFALGRLKFRCLTPGSVSGPEPRQGLVISQPQSFQNGEILQGFGSWRFGGLEEMFGTPYTTYKNLIQLPFFSQTTKKHGTEPFVVLFEMVKGNVIFCLTQAELGCRVLEQHQGGLLLDMECNLETNSLSLQVWMGCL